MEITIELLIRRLLAHYNIKTLTDLAIKLDTTQSTISGWKNRNAIGVLVDILVIKEPELLSDLFKISETNERISINNILFKEVKVKTEKYGISIDSYIEHLIIQDLEKRLEIN